MKGCVRVVLLKELCFWPICYPAPPDALHISSLPPRTPLFTRQHVRDRHSNFMPRWDRSRARPLIFDLPPLSTAAQAAAGAAAPSGAGGRGRGARGGRGGRGGRESSGAREAAAATAATAAAAAGGGRGGRGGRGRGRRGGADAAAVAAAGPDAFPPLPGPPSSDAGSHQGEGTNFQIIDDDLGDYYEQHERRRQQQQAAAAARAEANAFPPLAGAGGAAAAPRGTPAREDFPSLQAAADPAVAKQQPPPRAAAAGPPQMVKVVAKCGCGRRELHLLLRAGEAAPAVPCDRACEAASRKAQLASAFGVANPEHHASYFERHRTVSYSVGLILLAKEDVSESGW